MKSWFESLLIALSMYSTLPVKCLNWTPRNLRHAMACFPLVGLLCGAALWVVWMVCGLLHTGSVLFGALAVLSGVLVTGGIHLDGFCDTADALYSRREQAEKLRILKDPHCGPFAVFSVILVLLLSFGAYTELYRTQGIQTAGLLTGGFVLIRCLPGISVTTFPMFWHWLALCLLLLTLLIFGGCARMEQKQFGGVTGDLAGFFLVLGETGWLLGAALLGGVFSCV